ncbi:MAG TPA: GNAT family N-acetyltransferase [Lachnospiraceae bacterium]|nr:GNAT family N-acetyltransferase [Lachnospiraceae bacterium]
MRMKILSATERKDFYNIMKQDFPKSELKSFSMIEELVQKGNYLCYGFFRGNQPYGYIYLTKSTSRECVFIDYFAVLKEHRSKGLGSTFLEELKCNLDGNILMLEVEDPIVAIDENDLNKRNRRIDFYLKNGLTMTNIKSRVFSDEYCIMAYSMDDSSRNDILEDELADIYLLLFGKDYFDRNIRIMKD